MHIENVQHFLKGAQKVWPISHIPIHSIPIEMYTLSKNPVQPKFKYLECKIFRATFVGKSKFPVGSEAFVED